MRGPSRILPDRRDLPRAFPEESGPAADSEDPLEASYRRGVEDGREHGRREVLEGIEAERKDEREALRAALAELGSLRDRTLRELEKSLLRLAAEAVSTIVRTRIDEGDPVAVRALAEALARLPEGEAVRVRMHPDDVAAAAELSERVPASQIELVPDDAITRGGCRIDTGAGVVDATLETAEAVVREAMLGREDAP